METAVDWLIEQLTPSIKLQQKYIDELKEEAKAIEREQVIIFTNNYLDDGSNILIHISQLIMEIELNTDNLSPLRHSNSFLKLKKFTNDEFYKKYDIAEEFKNLFDTDET